MKQMKLEDYVEFKEERFTKRVIFKEGEDAVFVLNFEPQQALPTHKHLGSNLYLLVLEGGGTFTIDGKEVKAKKNDLIYAEGEEDFTFVNDSNGRTSLYVVLSKIPGDEYAQNI